MSDDLLSLLTMDIDNEPIHNVNTHHTANTDKGNYSNKKDSLYDRDFTNDVMEINPNIFIRNTNSYIVTSYIGKFDNELPESVLTLFAQLSKKLADKNYRFRAGGDNRDSVEEIVIKAVDNKVDYYLPWNKFNGIQDQSVKPNENSYKISSKYHKVFNQLNPAVRCMIARNTHRILGVDLATPIDMLICYTFDGVETTRAVTPKTGSVGHMISICEIANIPVFNLHNSASRLTLFNKLQQLGV